MMNNQDDDEASQEDCDDGDDVLAIRMVKQCSLESDPVDNIINGTSARPLTRDVVATLNDSRNIDEAVGKSSTKRSIDEPMDIQVLSCKRPRFQKSRNWPINLTSLDKRDALQEDVNKYSTISNKTQVNQVIDMPLSIPVMTGANHDIELPSLKFDNTMKKWINEKMFELTTLKLENQSADGLAACQLHVQDIEREFLTKFYDVMVNIPLEVLSNDPEFNEKNYIELKKQRECIRQELVAMNQELNLSDTIVFNKPLKSSIMKNIIVPGSAIDKSLMSDMSAPILLDETGQRGPARSPIKMPGLASGPNAGLTSTIKIPVDNSASSTTGRYTSNHDRQGHPLTKIKSNTTTSRRPRPKHDTTIALVQSQDYSVKYGSSSSCFNLEKPNEQIVSKNHENKHVQGHVIENQMKKTTRAWSTGTSGPLMAQKKCMNNEIDMMTSPIPVTKKTSSLIPSRVKINDDVKKYGPINIEQENSAELDNFKLTPRQYSSDLHVKLHEVFGILHLRINQLEAINAALLGEDVLLWMAPGSGKSLCYQVVGVLKKGMTVVVSPLKSLIEDQVNYLKSRGIGVEHLIGLGRRPGALDDIFNNILGGSSSIKFLFMTPERLEVVPCIWEKLKILNDKKLISQIVVDEAHCVENFGFYYRREFENLMKLKIELPGIPVMALTGTANSLVIGKIQDMLGLENCKLFYSNFNRPNVKFSVMLKLDSTTCSLAIRIIEKDFLKDTGIIFGMRIEQCREMVAALNNNNISAEMYNGQDADGIRSKRIARWMSGELKILCATDALGMGINNGKVKFVIHLAMPMSLGVYVQQCGRAGRDDGDARCILMWSIGDVSRNQGLIAKQSKDSTVMNYRLEGLDKVVNYCVDTDDCRRSMLLENYGQMFNNDYCDEIPSAICDNCANNEPYVDFNVTCYVQEILKLVNDVMENKARLTGVQLINLVKGRKNLRLIKKIPHGYNVTTIFQKWQTIDIFRLLRCLISRGDLSEYIRKLPGSEYGIYLEVNNLHDDCNGMTYKLRMYVKNVEMLDIPDDKLDDRLDKHDELVKIHDENHGEIKENAMDETCNDLNNTNEENVMDKPANGLLWKDLVNYGPLLESEYDKLPGRVTLIYNGTCLGLSRNAEGYACHYASVMDNPKAALPTCIKNFFNDWRKSMTRDEAKTITDFHLCDFTKIRDYLKIKNNNDLAKEKHAGLVARHARCIVDGQEVPVRDCHVESSGVYLPEDENDSRIGHVERRLTRSDVTLNCSKLAPDIEDTRHEWGGIVERRGGLGLARWTSWLDDKKEFKYVVLDKDVVLDGAWSIEAWDVARRLGKSIENYRKMYQSDWINDDMMTRQCATVLYFVDRHVMRPGHEKNKQDDVDGMGVTKLLVQNVVLLEHDEDESCEVVFKFTGNDAVEFDQVAKVPGRVYKNLKLFSENKAITDEMFNLIDVDQLDKYIKNFNEKMTSKTWLTWRASMMFQKILNKQVIMDYHDLAMKLTIYNNANCRIANICNDRKKVGKDDVDAIPRLEAKIFKKSREIKTLLQEVEKDKTRLTPDQLVNDTRYRQQLLQLDKSKQVRNVMAEQVFVHERGWEFDKNISRINYLDPRITVAWCARNDVPIDKIYNKKTREKFQWAIKAAEIDFEY